MNRWCFSGFVTAVTDGESSCLKKALFGKCYLLGLGMRKAAGMSGPPQSLSKTPWLLMWMGTLEASPVDRAKLGKEKGVTSLLCKSLSLLWCFTAAWVDLQRDGGFLKGSSFCVASLPWCTAHGTAPVGSIPARPAGPSWVLLHPGQPHIVPGASQPASSGAQHPTTRSGCNTLDLPWCWHLGHIHPEEESVLKPLSCQPR